MEKKNESIGALWEKKDKNGNVYYAGILNEDVPKDTKIALFKNKFKEKETQPDYRILKSVAKETNNAETKASEEFGF